MLRLIGCVVGLMLLRTPITPTVPHLIREEKMHRLASHFLLSLNETQKHKALIEFNSEERLNWHYIPRARKGVPLKELNEAQLANAQALLKAGLSVQGMEKVSQIRELEGVLKEIEKGTGPTRDPDLYYVSIFGEPNDSGAWGWRFEGHHLSLNWTIIQGRVIASSPQFLGTNPAEVRSGSLKGRRVLHKEEDLGLELVRALSPEQRKVAILSDTAPPDIITAAQRQVDIQEAKGIAYNRLTKEQQGILIALIQEYATVQNPAIAKQRLEKVRKAGLNKVVFAWMGGLERGMGTYYRVQGSTFLIEFDNTQNNNNHIHAVWRDYKNDWGADLLADHYHKLTHKDGHHHDPDEDHDHDHDH